MKNYLVEFSVTDPLMNRNTALTMSHETAIMASHMAAFLIMLSHASYFLLSPPEVIIWNPAYSTSISVIVARIHKTQLIAVCMVRSRESSCCSSVHIVWIQLTPIVSPNHAADRLLGRIVTPNKAIDNIVSNIIFLILISFIK